MKSTAGHGVLCCEALSIQGVDGEMNPDGPFHHRHKVLMCPPKLRESSSTHDLLSHCTPSPCTSSAPGGVVPGPVPRCHSTAWDWYGVHMGMVGTIGGAEGTGMSKCYNPVPQRGTHPQCGVQLSQRLLSQCACPKCDRELCPFSVCMGKVTVTSSRNSEEKHKR